ncbi:DUF1302 domain-containing protein [Aromatoleum petrolei]|uniref:DUF1302 family protein n=1 Tax=Aromatoleum petrolei TaxID=76116 RepID=A0ABX1MN73_9RHOO|nr:DUF1302 family protein [Aromatoleum petrolei]NMF88645.1 DUF1302 family protein [Aromatoleum petrolei]QTQ34639.1 putative protein DUF1302 [Aromatoleum petrolei]
MRNEKTKGNVESYEISGTRHWKRSTVFLAVAMAVGSGPASAFKIETDNPDVQMSLDTTLRYNALWRASEREAALVNSNTDEGNYLFDKGDLALSRFDVYSEFDLNVRNMYGFRLSGTAWYDPNFPDEGKSDPRFAAVANYPGNRFTNTVKRFYQGPSGEFLDAFGWANLEPGGTQLNVKVGRFAWLPGEFLFGNGGSVSFSMAPNDGRKTDLSPGASAKETAIPIGQAGLIWQLSPAWTAMAQYTGEFRSSRISEGGTFFAVGDGATLAPPFLSFPAVPRGNAREGDKGDVALGVKFAPSAWQGNNLSFWYRKFDDKNPTWLNQVLIGPTGPEAHAVYAQDIKLYGVTSNLQVGEWAVGAELNYRENMPLAQRSGVVFGAGSKMEGPRGNTYHALLSGAKVFTRSALFDSAPLAFQFDYTYLDKITKNRDLFNGDMRGVAGFCDNNEILRGCATRSAASVGVSFTPTWQQVFPGMDVSMPLLLIYGLHGNAAAAGAGTMPEESYLIRIGGRVDYYSGNHKHQFDLSYTQRDGKKGTLPGAATRSFSGLANFRDRDYVVFTYSTAF